MLPRALPTLLALSLTLTLLGAACSDDTSGPVDSGHLDRTVLPDVTLKDSSVDMPIHDGLRPDTTSDSSAGDSTVDIGASVDSTLDGGTSVDSTLDSGTSVDSTLDSGASTDSTLDSGASIDSTLDSAGAGPCVQGATESVLVADTMVGCITTHEVNQCAAASACGGGWHLCTASEYQARYGAANPGLTSNLWIAGCVREGGAPFAPTDSVCNSCGGATGSEVEISWWCNGITASTSELNIGLRTAPACSNVGVDDNGTQAFWVTIPSSWTLSGGLCCK